MDDLEKIEVNLNFGMVAAKQQHVVIQPQILPNLLDHSQKKEFDSNNAQVVIGVILGKVDGKMIDITNSFPMPLKIAEKRTEKENQDEDTPK